MEFLWLWLCVMLPLVFSPGPANLVFATSGATVGLKRSLPLLFGVDLVFILQSALIGFGAGVVLEKNPIILQSLQFIGAMYLVYLAISFLKISSAAKPENSNTLGFMGGVVVQTFNAKGWVMLVLMYSLFSMPAQDVFGDYSVVALIIMLAILNISLHLVWIKLGATLQLLMKSERSQRYQYSVYACALFFVAGWLLIDNSIWQ